MQIKYIFWLEKNYIETYKNGKKKRYKGEEKYNLLESMNQYWELWKENAEEDDIENTSIVAIGDNVSLLQKFLSQNECFNEKNRAITFEDIRSILELKELDAFLLRAETKEIPLKKIANHYYLTPIEENMRNIFILGDYDETSFDEHQERVRINIEKGPGGQIDSYFYKKNKLRKK